MPRPRRARVAAIAKEVKGGAANDAVICGPEDAFRRVHDFGYLARTKIAPPPPCAIGPRGRRDAKADPPGNLADNGPADLSVSIGDDEVLLRQAGLVGGVEGFPQRAGGLKRTKPRKIDRVGIVRGPAPGIARAAGIARRYRPPNRFFDFNLAAGLAEGANMLLHLGKAPRSLWGVM